jgi:hypothetical protein
MDFMTPLRHETDLVVADHDATVDVPDGVCDPAGGGLNRCSDGHYRTIGRAPTSSRWLISRRRAVRGLLDHDAGGLCEFGDLDPRTAIFASSGAASDLKSRAMDRT